MVLPCSIVTICLLVLSFVLFIVGIISRCAAEAALHKLLDANPDPESFKGLPTFEANDVPVHDTGEYGPPEPLELDPYDHDGFQDQVTGFQDTGLQTELNSFTDTWDYEDADGHKWRADARADLRGDGSTVDFQKSTVPNVPEDISGNVPEDALENVPYEDVPYEQVPHDVIQYYDTEWDTHKTETEAEKGSFYKDFRNDAYDRNSELFELGFNDREQSQIDEYNAKAHENNKAIDKSNSETATRNDATLKGHNDATQEYLSTVEDHNAATEQHITDVQQKVGEHNSEVDKVTKSANEDAAAAEKRENDIQEAKKKRDDHLAWSDPVFFGLGSVAAVVAGGWSCYYQQHREKTQGTQTQGTQTPRNERASLANSRNSNSRSRVIGRLSQSSQGSYHAVVD